MPYQNNRMSPYGMVGLVGVLAIMGLMLPAYALPEDKNQPIDLTADTAEYDQKTGISIYRGNVKLVQGTFVLQAKEARVYLVNGELSRVEATGQPVQFQYQPSANKELIKGQGKKVEYRPATHKVVVSGNAHFIQAGDELNGEVMEYDVLNNVIKATAGTQPQNGQQVRIKLQPKNTKDVR